MPRDNRLPSYESILEFQEVYSRAVALAWRDKEFKAALLADTGAALAHYFGYRCPWNVELRVRAVDGSEHQWDPKLKKWDLPPNKTSISIPDAPKLDQQLVAIAAYNDAGPTYLFTCC